MKKLTAILLCALMALMPVCAAAEDSDHNSSDPRDHIVDSEHDTSTGATFDIEVNGHVVSLDFDASEQYSSIEDNLVQASYFKYDGDYLYELFIVFPEAVQAGDVVTPDYAALTRPETSLLLIVSNTQTKEEQYFLACLMDGTAYPDGANYAITIDSVDKQGEATRYAGTISATLISLNMMTGEVVATLEIPETPFSFTIGGDTFERPGFPKPSEKKDDMRDV